MYSTFIFLFSMSSQQFVRGSSLRRACGLSNQPHNTKTPRTHKNQRASGAVCVCPLSLSLALVRLLSLFYLSGVLSDSLSSRYDALLLAGLCISPLCSLHLSCSPSLSPHLYHAHLKRSSCRRCHQFFLVSTPR